MQPTNRFKIGYSEGDHFDPPAHIADTALRTGFDKEGMMMFMESEDQFTHLQRNNQLLCNPNPWQVRGEGLTLDEFADVTGSDTTTFRGESPDLICETCWDQVVHQMEALEQVREGDLGSVGYRFRWTQKGQEQDESCEMIVLPEATMQDIDDVLVGEFSTLDDLHMRVYGLAGEYVQSSLDIIPAQQYDQLGIGQKESVSAAEVAVGELAERYFFAPGKYLSMAYDFGTPSHFDCEIVEQFKPVEFTTMADTAVFTNGKGTVAITEER